MFCKSCGKPHESESGTLEEEAAESPEFESGEQDGEDESKLDTLRELIEEMKGASGQRLASGGAVVRPLPKSGNPFPQKPTYKPMETPTPEPTPTSKPSQVAFGDEEEEDVSDIISRFKRKV